MWLIFAASASVLWGLTYVLMEPVVRRITIPTYLGIASLCSAIVLLSYSFFRGDIGKDLSILADDRRMLSFMVAATAAGIGANLLIVNAVSTKSASYATAIEIAYPLFVIFFAWLIFKTPVNAQMAAGAVLVFVGATVISIAQ